MTEFDTGFEQLDAFITQSMATSRTPGMAIGFFDRQRVIRIGTYGYADLGAGTPVTPATLFEIGSITKSFTAVAVLRAVEDGRLELQRPVTDYLPWFQVQTEFEPITLHHLLTHTAGLIGVIDRSPDIRGAVWALRETAAGWPPGSRFAYSDAGYQVLTLVLEAVYAQTFAEIIHEKLFGPLGMSASEAALTHRIRPRLARGYRYLYDDRPYQVSYPLVPSPWIEARSGDCSIASTAEDMAKFGQLLLNRGQGPQDRILSLESFERLVHPYCVAGWCEYGYGIMIKKQDAFTHVGHAGGMPGYVAELIADVDNQIGVVLLSTEPRTPGLFWQIMRLWRSLYLGQALDTAELTPTDPHRVENAIEYAGVYHGQERRLELIAHEQRLFLRHAGQQIVLEPRDTDRFYVHHADFDRFLLQFVRTSPEDGESGAVVEAAHGADWFVKEPHSGADEITYPAEWDAYAGHYRAHNPWQTNFRVLVRKGKLLLVWPEGDQVPLIPRSAGEFYVGHADAPERMRFKQIVNGQALCAEYSQSDYYRFFVP